MTYKQVLWDEFSVVSTSVFSPPLTLIHLQKIVSKRLDFWKGTRSSIKKKTMRSWQKENYIHFYTHYTLIRKCPWHLLQNSFCVHTVPCRFLMYFVFYANICTCNYAYIYNLCTCMYEYGIMNKFRIPSWASTCRVAQL